MTATNAMISQNSLVSKGADLSSPRLGSICTIVYQETPALTHPLTRTHRQTLPNARERRAIQDKQARQQRHKEHFTDATAFAYFRRWPLEQRITITWSACAVGERNEGHILALSEKARNEKLRSELARLLRKAGHPFACIWARDEGAQFGLHTHLGLYWPLPNAKLVKLLERLTGSLASSARFRRDVVAQSECGGWQIKRCTALRRLESAHRWAGYLVDQGERHLIVPRIEGKVIGVSRSIGYAALEAQKPALEAWKHDVGWSEGQSA